MALSQQIPEAAIVMRASLALAWIVLLSPPVKAAAPVFHPPEKLPTPINSSYLDTCPYLSPDGNEIIFASDRPLTSGSARADLNLWRAAKVGGIWQAPVNLGPQVNSTAIDSEPVLSPDGLSLYFTSDRATPGGGTMIYVSRMTGGVFQAPVALPSPVNESLHSNDPFISADGGMIYFSAYSRAGGLGLWDIWRSDISSGTYGIPINLGSNINRPDRQRMPSLTDDGREFYFLSQVSGPYEYRIYFSDVLNGVMGSPLRIDIDPPGYIHSARITGDGTSLLFSRNSATTYLGDLDFDIWMARKVLQNRAERWSAYN